MGKKSTAARVLTPGELKQRIRESIKEQGPVTKENAARVKLLHRMIRVIDQMAAGARAYHRHRNEPVPPEWAME